jgi:thiosulfate/3-mercaptopyruvate sulfurtransferase
MLRMMTAVAFGLTMQSVAPMAPSPLVTATALSKDLTSRDIIVLHVGPQDDYDAGHIAGAQYVTLADVSAAGDSGAPSLELPDDATLRDRLERFGIGNTSTIVVVAGADWLSPATRVLWTLQVAGLGAQTRFLDGGMVAWKRAGLATTRVPGTVRARGTLTTTIDRTQVMSQAWVLAHLRDASVHLIDARDPVYFEGAVSSADSRAARDAGHIPSAKNLPFNTLTTDAQTFESPEALRRKFAAVGVKPGDTIVVYCHIGQQGTLVILAARLAGIHARLYDGSFREWRARNLPVERAGGSKRTGADGAGR